MDKKTLKSTVLDIQVECSTPGWDGYDGEPITVDAVDYALRFIDSLPPHLVDPEIDPDANGNIGFEWRDKNNKIVYITAHNGTLIYAAILSNDHKTHGTETFRDEIPRPIEQILNTF